MAMMQGGLTTTQWAATIEHVAALVLPTAGEMAEWLKAPVSKTG